MADTSESRSAPTHVHGLPNPDRVGFVPGHLLEHGRYDFEASAAAVAGRLGRPVTFVDAHGFHDEIVAGAVDADRDRVAWLQCRSKDVGGGTVDVSFVLHATAGGKHGVGGIDDGIDVEPGDVAFDDLDAVGHGPIGDAEWGRDQARRLKRC